nr:ImmA/IrrE family metallo-endopeptidase [uncultured Clostridium sp.]
MGECRLADPLSRRDISEIARLVRKLIGWERENKFPIIQFIELILPQIIPEFQLIIETKDKMGECHGLTYPERKIIKLREDVYLRAADGSGRDRLTAAHELFHLLQHNSENISFARMENESEIPTFRNPEWQADAFGGELLAPTWMIRGMSAEDVASTFGVSLAAAKTQLKNANRC